MSEWKPTLHGTGAVLDLRNGLRASVSYESFERLPHGEPRFNVTVLGTRLPGRHHTLDEAKARAESSLRAALQSALEALA